MKRILALIFTLIMVMSLAACGNSTKRSNVSDNTGDGDVTETEIPDISETLAPEGSQGDTDPSGNGDETTEAEKLIIAEDIKPENFILSDSGADYETYTIENISYRDVLDYKDRLVEKGFCIQSYSMGSEIEADNLAYEIKYKFQYTGTESIISFTELERRAEQGLEDTGTLTVTVRARNLNGYNLPELPEGAWNIFDNDKKKVIVHTLKPVLGCSKEERITAAKNYVELLKGNGYSLNVEEHPEGKEGNYVWYYVPLYDFYAEDASGNSVEVKVWENLEFSSSIQTDIDEWVEIEITFKGVIPD